MNRKILNTIVKSSEIAMIYSAVGVFGLLAIALFYQPQGVYV